MYEIFSIIIGIALIFFISKFISKEYSPVKSDFEWVGCDRLVGHSGLKGLQKKRGITGAFLKKCFFSISGSVSKHGFPTTAVGTYWSRFTQGYRSPYIESSLLD